MRVAVKPGLRIVRIEDRVRRFVFVGAETSGGEFPFADKRDVYKRQLLEEGVPFVLLIGEEGA